MPKLKLTKPQKVLAAIIESEGGRLLAFHRSNKAGLKVDFTFGASHHVFTQTLPPADNHDRRWLLNFRSNVRKARRQTENPNP